MTPSRSLLAAALLVIPALASAGEPKAANTATVTMDATQRAAATEKVLHFAFRAEGGVPLFFDGDLGPATVLAREWAGKLDAGKLARLSVIAAPGSRLEARLVEAMRSWTKERRVKNSASQTAAFLDDLAAKSELIASDPRSRADIEQAIASNDGAGVVVPNSRDEGSDQKSIDEARRRRENMPFYRRLFQFGDEVGEQTNDAIRNAGWNRKPVMSSIIGETAGGLTATMTDPKLLLLTTVGPAASLPGNINANLGSGTVPVPGATLGVTTRKTTAGGGSGETRRDDGPWWNFLTGGGFGSGTYGRRLSGSGSSFNGAFASMSETMTEGLLNPMLFVTPGLGGLSTTLSRLSKPSSNAAVNASGAYLRASTVLTPATGETAGGGATITTQVVSASDAKRSEQSYLSGVIEFQKGDYEKARAQWAEALRLNPGNADAKAGLEKIRKLNEPVK